MSKQQTTRRRKRRPLRRQGDEPTGGPSGEREHWNSAKIVRHVPLPASAAKGKWGPIECERAGDRVPSAFKRATCNWSRKRFARQPTAKRLTPSSRHNQSINRPPFFWGYGHLRVNGAWWRFQFESGATGRAVHKLSRVASGKRRR